MLKPRCVKKQQFLWECEGCEGVLGLVVLFWFGSAVLQALGGWSRWVPAFRSDTGASTADP